MEEIKEQLIEELLKEAKAGREVFGPGGLIKELTGRFVSRILEGELTNHLGFERGEKGKSQGNFRNGNTRKTLLTEGGDVVIDVPRDRKGTFEPRLVKKHQRRLLGFDEKVLSLYARGMTVRDIQAHLEELYGTEISPDLVSAVTDIVVEDIRAWQTRPLASVWPVVYFDALVMKIRDEGTVRNKAVYIAIGIGMTGHKEVLGLWVEQTEGAKFWLRVMTELRNRGLKDVLIVCCDGLKGFPESIAAAFPKAEVQTCIVHMIRNSLRYVSFKDRQAVADGLKPIYRAVTVEAAEEALLVFEKTWAQRYPMIAQMWLRNWHLITPFFAFPDEIRRIIYTTNIIESLNSSLRKITRHRGHFPSDEAAIKLLYLALRNAEKHWTLPIHHWQQALNQFVIHFGERVPV